MAFLSGILIKYGQTLGALAMAALLRYLEKTSLIQKYKKQINEIVDKGTEVVNEVNKDNAQ
jgi:hypothetical protein